MKKANLFIKGMREPIEVEEEEGKEAQRVIADSMIPLNTPFSIEGVWTGTKADMKFVVFPKQEEERKDEPGLSIAMKREEAERFSKELEPYRKEAVRAGFKEHEGDLYWLQAQGALRIQSTDKEGNRVVSLYLDGCSVKDPKKFLEADKKLDAYRAYKEKVAYARKRDDAALEIAAERKALLTKTTQV